MTKRDIIETIYEYDENEKLIRKTVTETHEVDDSFYQSNWSNIPVTCTTNNL